jgi:hypothetical protein
MSKNFNGKLEVRINRSARNIPAASATIWASLGALQKFHLAGWERKGKHGENVNP